MSANRTSRSLAERRVFLAGIGAASPIDDDLGWLAARRRRAAQRERWMSPRWNLVAVLAALGVIAVTIEALPTIGATASTAIARDAGVASPSMPPSASATPSERTLAAAVAPPRAAAAAPDTRSLAERTALFPVLQAEAVLEAADERTRPAAGVHRARRQI
jgi:hypothetical protein